MLNILEKVQFGVSTLVILGASGLYAWQGTERSNKEFIQPVRITPKAAPKVSLPAKGGAPAAPAIPPEDKAILDRLKSEQRVNVAGKSLERAQYKIQKDDVSYVKREANYYQELDKAGSEILQGADGKMTRMRLKNLDEDSLIRKFGIENGDIIEFIDGERVEFKGTPSPADAIEYKKRFDRLIEKIEKGGKISLTITRNGQPMEVGFQL